MLWLFVSWEEVILQTYLSLVLIVPGQALVRQRGICWTRSLPFSFLSLYLRPCFLSVFSAALLLHFLS